jgi:PAS domain-containing protein
LEVWDDAKSGQLLKADVRVLRSPDGRQVPAVVRAECFGAGNKRRVCGTVLLENSSSELFSHVLGSVPEQELPLKLPDSSGGPAHHGVTCKLAVRGAEELAENAGSQVVKPGLPIAVSDVIQTKDLKTELEVADLRAVFDSANAPIIGVDKDCRINEWNQKVADIVGYAITAASHCTHTINMEVLQILL